MMTDQEGTTRDKPSQAAHLEGGGAPPCPRCHGLDVDGKSWLCGLCSGGGEPLREALESLMQRRGVAILETVRAKDHGLGYQVGMLLGDIARIAGINDPSLPPVPLARRNKRAKGD